MKKILLTMLLMATICISYSYPVYSYAQIEAVEKLMSYEIEEVTVTIGKEKKEFKTIEEAMQYLGENGYELVSSHITDCKRKSAHHIYTFKRKEHD